MPAPTVDIVRVAADAYKKYRSLRRVLNESDEDAASRDASILDAEKACEKAWGLLKSGEKQKCIDAIHESLEHASKIDNPFEQGFRLFVLADLWLELDRPEEAGKLASQAIATKFYQDNDREEKKETDDLSGIFDGVFDHLGDATSAPIITSVLVRTGNVDEAFEYARQMKPDNGVSGLSVWGILAAFCVTEGHYSELEQRVASLPSPQIQTWFCQGVVSGLTELKRRAATN